MKVSVGSRFFDIINVIFFILFCLVVIYPFWDMLVLSFSTAEDSIGLAVRLWPKKFVINAYQFAFRNSQLINAYSVTISRALIGTVFSLFCNVCFAYGLSKKELPFHNVITMIVLIPMFFSGGLIPNYLLMRQLGLFDNYLVYILPGAVGSFNIILLRNYFQNMDRSLEEAARIDGASYFLVVIQVVVPLSTPILATLALWGVVAHWNAWFDCMLYMNNKNLYTLGFILRRLLIDDRLLSDEMRYFMLETENHFLSKNLQAAIIIITVVPVICAYPFLQKYFVKGIMIGALKG